MAIGAASSVASAIESPQRGEVGFAAVAGAAARARVRPDVARGRVDDIGRRYDAGE